MKKLLSCVLCVLLLCSAGSASAYTVEDLVGCAVANGAVTSASFYDLTAPCSGTLEAFDLNAGDRVEAGQELMRMLTTKLTATEDAVVTWVFAQQGDSADALTARYGALVSMEPAQSMRIMASTAQAYNDEDNKHVHVGEILYFKSGRAGREEGAGRVVSAVDTDYVVDILTGEFESGESLTLYRDDDYAEKEKVGKGVVVRRDPLSAVGSGVVAQVLVEAGQSVKKGDVLVTLMGMDADMGASPVVSLPVPGVVAMLGANPGQQVWKGQLLARIYPENEMEIAAEVDEVYLKNIKPGDELPVTLDTDEQTVLTGTVTEISALGNTIANAAYYTVRLNVSGAQGMMLGQSAKVYLPR